MSTYRNGVNQKDGWNRFSGGDDIPPPWFLVLGLLVIYGIIWWVGR